MSKHPKIQKIKNVINIFIRMAAGRRPQFLAEKLPKCPHAALAADFPKRVIQEKSQAEASISSDLMYSSGHTATLLQRQRDIHKSGNTEGQDLGGCLA